MHGTGLPLPLPLLLLLLLPPRPTPASLQSRKESATLSHKETGEACEQHSECQTRCCVPTSLNPQKFCTTKNLILQCLPWRKPKGHPCSRHEECHSDCCVRTSNFLETFCTPKTMLSCTSWRKSHEQCWSLCCIQMSESSPTRCWPRTGFLSQCLPLHFLPSWLP
ncbi:leucine-rich colipase-like protein 1 isoform 2-T3 [Thomomys bottae]